jgi:AcrR family transcriptional regulator
MPRPTGKHTGQDTARQIKIVARQLMAEHGTAGLTLRGIAKQMGITAPAIYNYYPRLEDLITALIVDAFNALAEAMHAAALASLEASYGARILAIVSAYRLWAVENPIDFQLIYGNPIPGYVAPFDLTAPLARKPFFELVPIYLQAWQVGVLRIPAEYQPLPASVAAHIDAWGHQVGVSIPPPLFGLIISGWGRIHGLVMLELTHHIQPGIGDAAAFYRYEVEAYLQRLGLLPESGQFVE